MRNGKGPGYVRWAKVFNLKQLSQAVIYLKEHGDMDYAKTRAVYVEYRKAGYSQKFRSEHEADILIHQAAKSTLMMSALKSSPP